MTGTAPYGPEFTPDDRSMTPEEARCLARLKAGRSVVPWIEYRCRAKGRRSHVLATAHPVGIVPTLNMTPGVDPAPEPFKLGLWLRAGTLTRFVASAKGWSMEPGALRQNLPESLKISNFFDETEPPPGEWWVACRDTVTVLAARPLNIDVNDARHRAMRNLPLPVRQFVITGD